MDDTKTGEPLDVLYDKFASMDWSNHLIEFLEKYGKCTHLLNISLSSDEMISASFKSLSHSASLNSLLSEKHIGGLIWASSVKI